jgi:hypothetical protein
MGVAVADPGIALNQHLLAGHRVRPAKCVFAVIANKDSVRRRQVAWESSRTAANNSAPCFLPSLSSRIAIEQQPLHARENMRLMLLVCQAHNREQFCHLRA